MRLEDQVLSMVRANIDKSDGVTLTSDLRKELRLDSFGTLMLINAIEDALGIAVEEADFSRLNTVADVVSLLQTKYHCA